MAKKSSMLQLLFEAVIVGAVLTAVALVLAYILRYDYLLTARVGLLLFFSGFGTHLIFEGLGLNKLYCSQGYACRR